MWPNLELLYFAPIIVINLVYIDILVEKIGFYPVFFNLCSVFMLVLITIIGAEIAQNSITLFF